MRGVKITKTLLGLRVLLELGSIGLTGFMNLHFSYTHKVGGARQRIKRPTDWKVFIAIKNQIFLDGNNDGDFQKDLCFHSWWNLCKAALKTSILNLKPFFHRTRIKINKILLYNTLSGPGCNCHMFLINSVTIVETFSLNSLFFTLYLKGRIIDFFFLILYLRYIEQWFYSSALLYK